MRIAVISDTHLSEIAVKKAVKAVGAADMWLHAGDCSQDIRFLRKLVDVPIVAVQGNCDGHSTALIDEFIDVAGKKIWLTHGHRCKVKYGLDELVYWAKQYEVDIVVYGHSHIADIDWQGNILLFNPGSAAYPRDSGPTCGLIEVEDGNVEAFIVNI